MSAVVSLPTKSQAKEVIAENDPSSRTSKSAVETPLSSSLASRHALSLHEDLLDGDGSDGSSDVSVTAYSEGEFGILRVRRHARRQLCALPPSSLPRTQEIQVSTNPTQRRATSELASKQKESSYASQMDVNDCETELLTKDSKSCAGFSTFERLSTRQSEAPIDDNTASKTNLIFRRPQLSPQGPRPCSSAQRSASNIPSSQNVHSLHAPQRHSESMLQQGQHLRRAGGGDNAAEDVSTAILDAVLTEMEQQRHTKISRSSGTHGSDNAVTVDFDSKGIASCDGSPPLKTNNLDLDETRPRMALTDSSPSAVSLQSVDSKAALSSAGSTQASAYITDVDSTEAQRFLHEAEFSPRREHFYQKARADLQARESALVDPFIESPLADVGDAGRQPPANDNNKPSFIRVPSNIFPHTPAQQAENLHSVKQIDIAPIPAVTRRTARTATPLQIGVRCSARGRFWNPLPPPLRTQSGAFNLHENNSDAAQHTEEPIRFVVRKQDVPEDVVDDEGECNDDASSAVPCHYHRPVTRELFRATIYPRKPDEFFVREQLSHVSSQQDYDSERQRRRSRSLGQLRPPSLSTQAVLPPVHARMPRARAATLTWKSTTGSAITLCSWCSLCEALPASSSSCGESSSQSCGRNSAAGGSRSISNQCTCSWCRPSKVCKMDTRKLDMPSRCKACGAPQCSRCTACSASCSRASVCSWISHGDDEEEEHVGTNGRNACANRPDASSACVHVLVEQQPAVLNDSPTKFSSGSERHVDEQKVVNATWQGEAHTVVYPGAPTIPMIPILSPFYIDPYRHWPPWQTQCGSDDSIDGSSSCTTGIIELLGHARTTSSIITTATIATHSSATARLCKPGEVLRRCRPISRQFSRQRTAHREQGDGPSLSHTSGLCSESHFLNLDSGDGSSLSSSPSFEDDRLTITTSSPSSVSSSHSEIYTPPRAQYTFAGCESPGMRLSVIVSPLQPESKARDSTKHTAVVPPPPPPQAINIPSPVHVPVHRNHRRWILAEDERERREQRSGTLISSSSRNTAASVGLRSILKASSGTASLSSSQLLSSKASDLDRTPSRSISTTSSVSGAAGNTVPSHTPIRVQKQNKHSQQGDLSKKDTQMGQTSQAQTSSQHMDLTTRLQREGQRQRRNDERLGSLDKLEGRSKKSNLFAQLQNLRDDIHRRDQYPLSTRASTRGTLAGTQSASTNYDLGSRSDTVAAVGEETPPASPLTPTRDLLRSLELAYELRQQHLQFSNGAAVRLTDITGFDVGVVPGRAHHRTHKDRSPAVPLECSDSPQSSSLTSTSTATLTPAAERQLHVQLRKFSQAIEARQVAKARCVDK